jgi:hypothetical protein
MITRYNGIRAKLFAQPDNRDITPVVHRGHRQSSLTPAFMHYVYLAREPNPRIRKNCSLPLLSTYFAGKIKGVAESVQEADPDI